MVHVICWNFLCRPLLALCWLSSSRDSPVTLGQEWSISIFRLGQLWTSWNTAWSVGPWVWLRFSSWREREWVCERKGWRSGCEGRGGVGVRGGDGEVGV